MKFTKLDRQDLIRSLLTNPAVITECNFIDDPRRIASKVLDIVEEILKQDEERSIPTDPEPVSPIDLSPARDSFRKASDQFIPRPTLPETNVGYYSVKNPK